MNPNTAIEPAIGNRNKKSIPKKSSTKPTLPEIESYVKEKGLQVDPQFFFTYFEAGDWKDSRGNKVKSWKQKLLTWDRQNNSQKSQPEPVKKEVGLFDPKPDQTGTKHELDANGIVQEIED